MHLFHEYLCQQLDHMLSKRNVVVFYDPNREFEPFFDLELQSVNMECGLPQVMIKDRSTYLARFKGSLFALRAIIEPITCIDKPKYSIVYLPGVQRDRQSSIFMELESGGECYEPHLKKIARHVMRKRFTEGQIDEMLRPASVGYADVVSFLGQGEDGQTASILRTIFEESQSEVLLARWLFDESKDAIVKSRDATSELIKLIEARLGLSLLETTPVEEARDKALRYTLLNEFRSDLKGNPPSSLGMIPEPPSKEHLTRILGVALNARRDCSDSYILRSEKVASDLGLDKATIDPALLGTIDTFRFEERALLTRAGDLIASREYTQALGIVSGRTRSFWVDRDVARQAQWESCRLMAELGHEIVQVRSALSKCPNDPTKWVLAYTGENGWFRVDLLHRRLESWVAKMEEDSECEKALAVVRREHEELLKKMADGFSKILIETGWTVPGILHQTKIFPDIVQTMGGRVAYFFVDAMRFEMGVALAHQLDSSKDLTIRPAIAALPSITPVGMAALLPGASASFSVIEHKGKLAASIEGSAMPGFAERLKFLKAKVPDVVEITLGKLLGTAPTTITNMIGNSSLIIVRSQEIDFVGEMDGDLLARQVMDTVIGNLARAVRKLALSGIENFVITADHGHQFSIRKEDDMKTDSPGGKTIDIHRRCWIGHGGMTPSGTVRLSGADLGYETNLDFVFPVGLGVFKAGGGLSFHHGSASLQELVIPVISLRVPRIELKAKADKIAEIRSVPDKITNRTFVVRVIPANDIFSNDPVALRIVLISKGEQVGQAGMVIGAELDRISGILHVKPGIEANVGMMLTRDSCPSVRVVVLDPATDALLAQSGEIPVKLGM